MRFLNQSEAIDIDNALVGKYRFSVDQLIEMAGLSCALAVKDFHYPVCTAPNKVLVFCGPGNNGGDGLVCARHMKSFGYSPEIYYPKRSSNELYERLVQQCVDQDIPILEDSLLEAATADSTFLQEYILIIDALFGINFKPPVRQSFAHIINMLKNTTVPICSIDIPSGWDVENGPLQEGDIKPQMLISLLSPKMCASHFEGKAHYLGHLFVPKKLDMEYKLGLPKINPELLIIKLENSQKDA